MNKLQENQEMNVKIQKIRGMLDDTTATLKQCIENMEVIEEKYSDEMISDQIDFLNNLIEDLEDAGLRIESHASEIVNYFPEALEESKIDNKIVKEDKEEILSDNDKFLAHILNGVVKDVQGKFNVTATADFTTGMSKPDMDVTIKIKGDTLDLIDATSYLAKSIRNDDVEFEMDDTIKNNTVTCIVRPK